MLVLRRKIGEVIRINDDIRIIIQDVQNEHIVRIGIEAPKDVPVHRLEIYNLIQQENQSAGGVDALKWLKGVSDGNNSSSTETHDD